MFTEDLTALFADFGVTATRSLTGGGTQTATVLFDRPDNDIFHDMQITTEYVITYQVTDLTGMKTGDAITVNGTAYTVREINAVDDGALVKAKLKA